MLVFIPLTSDALQQLHADGLTDVDGVAATPALFEALGYADDSYAEDAEYAALTYASVASLTRGPHRLVAVASLADSGVALLPDPDGFGPVRLRHLDWTQVTSLFVGDPDDGAQEAAAATAVHGEELADAWEDAAVVALVEETDLMWFGPDEVAEVAALVAS